MGLLGQWTRTAYENNNCTAHANGNGCDMKIEKFKMIVKDADIHLWNYSSKYFGDNRHDIPHCHHLTFEFHNVEEDRWPTFYKPDFIEKYRYDPFMKVLVDEMNDFSGLPGHSLKDITEAINRYRSQMYDTEEHRLIFWLLFMAAINDDVYNNELSSIIDIAYCLGFNQSMISDWCRAVEYILSGNYFNDNCDLICETDEGKCFFLHQEKK